jgi:hypothetical protein
MIKPLGFLPGCPAGQHYDDALLACVSDTDTGGWTGGGGTATASPDFMKYALIGLGALLLIGAFAGGRASKKSKGGMLLSRTTTRSIFG